MSRPGDPIGPVEARWRGERGAKGDKGERGDSVLPRKVRRSLVVLFLLPSLLAIVVAVGSVVQEHQQRAQEQRQGRLVEEKICATLAALAKQKPPPGNPVTNPSRAYLQGQYATLIQLGPDLGCGRNAR